MHAPLLPSWYKELSPTRILHANYMGEMKGRALAGPVAAKQVPEFG